jgi:hypothetical protein
MIENTSFVLQGGNTITHPHTSRYSLHLRHALESVGLHRRYTLEMKKQVTTLRGAGACAHERRTGVVAAEGAVSKVHCPRYGHARNGAKQIHCAHLLCTDRRTPQLVVVQFKQPVSRRNMRSESESELGRYLSDILRKQTNKNAYWCACADTISLIPLLSLFVCRCTP